jgi:hypothetical protein
LHVSEHRIEATSGEPGDSSVDAGTIGPDAPSIEAAAVAAAQAPAEDGAPALAPEQGSGIGQAAPKAADESLNDAISGSRKIAIMSPMRSDSWDRQSWTDDGVDPKPGAAKSDLFEKRRLAAIAAVIILSAVAGALGGALATAGLTHLGADSTTASIQAKAQDDQILRLEAEVAALKSNVEHAAKVSVSQISKTADRIDRIEKAQAEPAAKLAKLSETVDKLRAAPAPTPVAAAAPAPAPAPVIAAASAAAPKDVTGSIPTASAAPAAAPKPEVARLPTVEGWVLRDVADGGAVIEGRTGIYEVFAGDPVPGLGRVDAIRRQDGRWVVVTSRGLIVAR